MTEGPPNLLSKPSQKRLREAALRVFAERGSEVSLSDLAQAAGVARGTIYNNSGSTAEVLAQVADELILEMHHRVVKSCGKDEDPVHHLANGIRFFARRAHEEPHWGRFVNRFALNNPAMFGLWHGPFMDDILRAMKAKQYDFQSSRLPTVVSMIAGSVLGAMFLVMEGHKTWRDAGSETAEFILRALGISAEEASRLAKLPLPPLLGADNGKRSSRGGHLPLKAPQTPEEYIRGDHRKMNSTSGG